MVMLSLISGNEEVGIYGAAYRIFESTMFLTSAFTSAIFPWFSRKRVEDSSVISRGYEIGLLVMLSILTPIGVACTVLAAPIVHTLYGTRYDESITPLRLLGAVVIAFGINTFTSSTLAANDRPRLMHSILLITVFQNIVMNALLIPPYGADRSRPDRGRIRPPARRPQHSPGNKDAWARAPDPGFSRTGRRRRGDGGRRHTRPGLARREPLTRKQRLRHRAADRPARVLPR